MAFIPSLLLGVTTSRVDGVNFFRVLTFTKVVMAFIVKGAITQVVMAFIASLFD